MIVLVIGGAASGKSQLAEDICQRIASGGLVYIATMQAGDGESVKRIEKHQKARLGKGFDTVECPNNLHELCFNKPYNTALIECMSNLVANEMFDGISDASAIENSVISAVKSLEKQLEHVVIVTNNLFGDGIEYSPETTQYLALLGKINALIAGYAQVVVESVCGIPVVHKGREENIV